MTNPPLPQPGEPPVANETIAVPCTCWLGEPTREDCPKHGGPCAECGAARATHTRGDQSYCDEIQALRAETAKLREIAEKVATHEWIIGSAYRERPTSEFGWQVNVRDGEPDERGSQHYKALRETFALHPADAGLNALPDSRGK